MLFRLALVCLHFTLFIPVAMAIEEPKFTLIEKVDAFELRAYKPIIVAEVLVDGDRDEATNKGFRLIADYIFGNNKSKSGGSEKISMTAPVSVEPKTEQESKQENKSEKIAMTVPVSLQQAAGKWRVHFVMPSQYTMQTLPAPNNSQVMLREVAAQKFAVLRFSGLTGEAKITKNTADLLDWMAEKQLKPIGTPQLARYNPPWTLPFLRRNELLVAY